MPWAVLYHDAFVPELDALPEDVQDALLAAASLLAVYGPALGRPHADTLEGSRYANMKELRFRVGERVWRAAFAFDPERQAILLVAGDKAGVAQRRFYKGLIARAERPVYRAPDEFGKRLRLWLAPTKRSWPPCPWRAGLGLRCAPPSCTGRWRV